MPVPAEDLVSRNSLKARLARNELCLCLAIRLVVQPDIVLIARAAGFDVLYIDLGHGSVSPEACRHVAATAIAAGLPCLVRVPEVAAIPRLLDCGLAGIIVPNVASAGEAREVVAAARFPPLGRRGVAATFPNHGYRPVALAEALPALNDASTVILQIESRDGLDNVEAIAAVEGVDMLLVGTNDLLADTGLPGQFGHERVARAFARVAAACKVHGVALGIDGLAARPDLVAAFVAMGGSFISAGSDVGFLAQSARATVRDFRAMVRNS